MKQAVAIFAKTPLPGQVKTRLAPRLSPEQGADLYRCMLLDTLARVQTLGIDTFLFFEGEEAFFREAAPGLPLLAQQGDGLGERLEHAFSTLAALGYRFRVVIGSDAPDLPLSYLEDAFHRMAAGSEVVFGPAEDGGYYLVALSGDCGELFREIPWSGPRVLEQSLERAREGRFPVSLLPPWYDVDVSADLCRPGLHDPSNRAPLTRSFLAELGISPLAAADGRLPD